MDRLATMATFVKVVQYSSFTDAGADLGVSRALVSRHIADLEKELGVRLLNRTTRSVTPTEAGKQYFESCQKVLTEVRNGDEAVKTLNTEVQGNLAILAPNWVGYLEASAALTQFCRRYPKVNLQFTLGEGTSHRTHDFLERGYDIAFQAKRIPDSRIRVKKIASISYVAVASPAYLAQFGTPEHPSDLEHHACLGQTGEFIWRFAKGEEQTVIRVTPRFSSDSPPVLCMAALNDLGICVVPRRVAAEFSPDGQLQQVLSEFELENRPLYAAYAPGTILPRKVRALLTFLDEWFREHPLR